MNRRSEEQSEKMGRSGGRGIGRMFLGRSLSTLLAIAFLFPPGLAQAGSLSALRGGWLVIDKNLMEMIMPKSVPLSETPSASLSELAGKIATENGLPPELVRSVIKSESNGDAKAISSRGAMGLMQLMPETARGYRVFDPFDPISNLRGGVQYLRDLLQEFSGNVSFALAAYNAGPGAVRKYQGIPPYPETQAFVRKVKQGYESGEAPMQSSLRQPVKEIVGGERFVGKIRIIGSPRDLALFLKKARSTNLEAPIQ